MNIAKLYDYNDKIYTIKSLSEMSGVSIPALNYRINVLKMSVKEAVETDFVLRHPKPYKRRKSAEEKEQHDVLKEQKELIKKQKAEDIKKIMAKPISLKSDAYAQIGAMAINKILYKTTSAKGA